MIYIGDKAGTDAIFFPYSAQLVDKLNNSHFKKNLNFLKQCFHGKEEKEWIVNEIFDIYAEILKAWNIDKEDR